MAMIEEMENIPRDVLWCPQCHGANLPQWNYCAQCGVALWEACLQCGELCATGESFCPACGVRLSDGANAIVEQLETEIHTAYELQASCRFDEAVAIVEPISKNNHVRVAQSVAKAKQLLDELIVQRGQLHQIAAETYRRAQELFAAFDYHGASQLLETLPLSAQTNAIQQLRRQIVERLNEIATLEEELRTAVREKRLFDLPPRIERILAMQPEHAYANTLAAQVRNHLVIAAQKKLATYAYDEALQLLDQIAPPAKTPESLKLHRNVSELAWLAGDLRRAPVMDATLTAVAERLRRLAPNDARVAKLQGEIQRRIQVAQSEQRRPPLPWANAPQPTALGVPVDWLVGFQRIHRDAAFDAADLSQHPGRFIVACGLALAGIRQAALHLNLLSGGQRGVFSRMTELFRSMTLRTAWGIDIGASGLKAVKLTWHEGKHEATIEAAVFVEHSKTLSFAANHTEEKKIIETTLTKFLERVGGKSKVERICASMPGRMALCRMIASPPADPAKAVKFVEAEIWRHFHVPLDHLTWDYQTFSNAPAGTNASSAEVPASPQRHDGVNALMAAVKQSVAQRFLDAFRQVGLNVEMLQTDFIAVQNFLLYEQLIAASDVASDKTPGVQLPSVVASLDIGCDTTNVVVSSPQSLWFRSCGIAGQSFTRALVKEFQLSVAQAEQLKRAPESAERMSDLYATISPLFEDLTEEIQRLLASYAEAEPNRPIQRIFGLGGGFALHGLFRHLRGGR